MKEEFSTQMKKAMFLKGIKQTELSVRTGIDKGSLSSYMHGRYMPNAEKVSKIAHALGVSVNYLLGKEDLSAAQLTIPHFHEIPVLGKVAAGVPIDAQEDIIGTVTTDKSAFALRIKGDSMSPRIMDGDVVLVHPQDHANDGDLVIVEIDGQATCKVLKRNAYGVTLVPFNAAYTPLVFSKAEAEEMHILGKVVESRHEW